MSKKLDTLSLSIRLLKRKRQVSHANLHYVWLVAETIFNCSELSVKRIKKRHVGEMDEVPKYQSEISPGPMFWTPSRIGRHLLMHSVLCREGNPFFDGKSGRKDLILET